ncbi:MAG TPA: hypothetical protein VGP25_15385 [Gemmatimonadaceae bacterium]|jgi:hypothetical protein|nr:hypothetical protein [Gemmatimonadaceae bacterium]
MSSSAESSEETASNRFERHPVLSGLAIALFLLLATDLVVGQVVGIRRLRLTEYGYAQEQRYRVPSARYHHDLAPGTAVDSAMWGAKFYPVRTNSLGLKDATTRRLAPQDTVPRVLLLGDSFTEGIGVPFPVTFAGRLAARVRPAQVDVLNGGVSSYSPMIYWRKTVDLVARRGLHVGEVVVFMDISDIQDEASYYLDRDSVVHNPWGSGYWRPVTRDVLLGLDSASGPLARMIAPLHVNAALTHTLLYRLRHPETDRRSERPSCDPPLNPAELRCRGGWTSDARIMARYGRAGLANADEHMTRLDAFLSQRGIPLTIVVYPWPQQLYWNDRASVQVSHWRDWAASHHVRFVELFSDVFAAVDALGVKRVVEQFYIPGDVHLSSAGHAFVADRFARRYCAAETDASAHAPFERGLCGGATIAELRGEPVLPPPAARR